MAPPLPAGPVPRLVRQLLWPAVLLIVLWLLAVAAFAVPGLLLVVVFLVAARPIFTIAIATVALLTLAARLWRKSAVAGCATLLVPVILTLLIQVPSPSRSIVRWWADLARVVYFRSDLQRTYAEAEKRGQTPAVAALAVDGFSA